MKKLLLLVLGLLLLICFFLGCKPLNTPEEDISTWATELKGIPSEYGKLTAVTTITAYPNWAQLWFEDDQNVIRMVRIQWAKGLIHKDVVTIPRINN